jgi:hypothetical protein
MRAQRSTAALPVPPPVRAVGLRYRAPPPVDPQPWVRPQQQHRAESGQTTAAAPSSPPADSPRCHCRNRGFLSLGRYLMYQAGHYWNSAYIMVIFAASHKLTRL